MFLMVCQFCYFMTDSPIEGLNLCTCLEINYSVPEKVKCLFANVFGIVPVLEKGTL